MFVENVPLKGNDESKLNWFPFNRLRLQPNMQMPNMFRSLSLIIFNKQQCIQPV